jgi:2-aminoethylphosphonate-pyruvate transaminase
MSPKHKTIETFVAERNASKFLFTAGPGSLLPENLTGLRPCFGRGDEDYLQVEASVLDAIKIMTGHSLIARLQGSASLALEVMALNFLYGRVLVVGTGYYSDRLKWLADSAHRRCGAIHEVAHIDWRELDNMSGNFDWVFACYTETSCGFKLPIDQLNSLSIRLGAKLMLDATASIGLEPDHGSADVIGFSSCKGLFGLTGAAFISFNKLPSVEVDSFYLKLSTHLDKMMTGPYHVICSLVEVLPRHKDFLAAVVENKRAFTQKMQSALSWPNANQPLLCTHVTSSISSLDKRSVIYKPRSNFGGSVVCHIGEVHLGEKAHGAIQNALEICT